MIFINFIPYSPSIIQLDPMRFLCLYFILQMFIAPKVIAQVTNSYSSNRLVVKMKVTSNEKDKSDNYNIEEDLIFLKTEILNNYSVDFLFLGNINHSHNVILQFKESIDVVSVTDDLVNTGLFEYVELDYFGIGAGVRSEGITEPNDSYFNRQWGLKNDGSLSLTQATSDSDVDMDEAWELEQGSESIVVAILDSGVRLMHPEFSGRIWQNINESNSSSDDDNNGYVDDIVGWDFVNNDNDPTDDHGHGTNVAGIVGANANNSIGYAGVDWNCKIMACKILDENNNGLYSNWSNAIYYAVDNGAHVINMSVGGSSYSRFFEDAVNYAIENGVVIVASMMNNDNSQTFYPAGFINTIAVGSTDPDDERSSPFFWDTTSGSSYGSHIDVVAPGNYIYGLAYNSNFNYNSYWGGTSQATPLVAGMCSLLLAQDNSRTPGELREIIRHSSEDQVGYFLEDLPGFDIYYGYGRVNAYRALSYDDLSSADEVEYKSLVSVYPNPSIGELNVNINKGAITFFLYNQLGSLVLQGYYGNDFKIDTTVFAKGFYILKVKTKLGESELYKILIN